MKGGFGNGRTRCYFLAEFFFVDRDELKTEVMVSGRFLRGVVFLCIVIRSTFMTVQQPSDLYINADSGKASVCTNFGHPLLSLLTFR